MPDACFDYQRIRIDHLRYEFWIEVGPEVESDDQAQVKAFDGGLYAVTRRSAAHILRSRPSS